MTSINRVKNLPAFGAIVPVAALSALVGLLLLTSMISPAAAGALFPAKPVDNWRGIHWQIVPEPTCPDSVTRIQFDACRCNVEFIGVTQTPNGPIALRARIQPYVVCGWCDPDTISFPIGQLAAGNFVITLEIVADVVDSLGQTQHETAEFPVPFFVTPDCHKYPGAILPYLDHVQIGRGPEWPGGPDIACGVPFGIPVNLAGEFPDPCTWLREV